MKYLVFLSLISLSLTKCSDTNADVSATCDTEVRVVDLNLDGCGLVLELQNGDRLLPYEIVPDFELKAGQVLKIGYTKTDVMNTCMAGQTVRIDCIDGLSTTLPCDQSGEMKAVDVEEWNKSFQSQLMLQDLVFENGQLKTRFGYSGCDPERSFKLILDPAMSKSFPPQRNAKIVFEEQLCQAFFTQVICFPIQDIQQETILKIDDGSGNIKSIKVKP